MSHALAMYPLPRSGKGYLECFNCGDFIFTGQWVVVQACGPLPLRAYHPDCDRPDGRPLGGLVKSSMLPFEKWDEAVWAELTARLGGDLTAKQRLYIVGSGYETGYDLGSPVGEVADQLMEEMPDR
jgi:hypothetical protein